MSDIRVSQKKILQEFYINNPNRDILHPEIVDWAVTEYNRRTGRVFRDPDRGIRQLAQSGFLIKVSQGVYKYDPDFVCNIELEDFTQEQKHLILKKDGFKCVICGKGRENGVTLHIDHIRPKALNGKAIIENGQVLCAQHNFQKKTLKQTETGKKMFIRLYELAKFENNEKLIKFCSDILQVFEAHNINGHIEWKK